MLFFSHVTIFAPLKRLIYILLILTLNSVVFANNKGKEKMATKTICGRITSQDGEEISGVKIIIEETGETYFTDLNGKYQINLKTDKVYTLNFETIGFEPLKISSNKIGSLTDLSLNSL